MLFSAEVYSAFSNPDTAVQLLPAEKPSPVMLCLPLVLVIAVVVPSVSTASMTADAAGAIQCRSVERSKQP